MAIEENLSFVNSECKDLLKLVADAQKKLESSVKIIEKEKLDLLKQKNVLNLEIK